MRTTTVEHYELAAARGADARALHPGALLPGATRAQLHCNLDLHAIKAIFEHYAHWIEAVLLPLGPWGVFAIASVDASFLGLPMDLVIAGYVYHDHARLFLYVLLGSAGSALGSGLLYLVGYLGGEKVLRKRISAERFAKIHASFERHQFWTLMFPAMLPPPTPFKLFVLAAAVFEMRFRDFLAAIFAGRFLRFLILSILTIVFGPEFVRISGEIARHHFGWVLAGAALALLLWLVLRWRRRNRAPAGNLSQITNK
ncbi:MAG TPA: VTT domain-containing protein [Terriglobales bacterium]|nr:VTT domain-containing protein [Terriglobales bacterium]